VKLFAAIFAAVAVIFCVSCTNTEKCLQKLGYNDCEHLKNALNLQNSDESLKYHSIKKKCGCKD
jgi:hypothetical protein